MPFDLRPLLNGDKRAWDAFVERYAPVIHAAVRKALGRTGPDARGDVADATQEVFVRLLKNDCRLLRSYDPSRASLPTWLTLVARSAALDWLRRGRRHAGASLEDLPADPPAPQRAPSSHTPTVDRSALTGRQQLVLRLLFDENLSVAEVADLLGLETQTIRSTKHKALSALRKNLRKT